MIAGRIIVLAVLAVSAVVLAAAARPAAAQAVTGTDVLGRQVSLPAPARRIVLAQGRQIGALAFILRDPVAVLVGWGGDFRRQDPSSYARYRAAFPAIDGIRVIGEGTAETLSIETLVATAPDLVVLSRSMVGARRPGAPGGDLVARLEQAGLKVAVVDFFIQPLTDTVPSLRALGKWLGREAEAEAFLTFYEAHLATIRRRVAGLPPRTVFMQAHADGAACCNTPGRGTFTDLIEAAGGNNIAAALLPGVTGQLSVEKVITSDPDVFVATGGAHLASRNGLVLGHGVAAESVRDGFRRILATPGVGAIGAVGRGRAYGFAHLFNDTPLHIVGIEVLAKWFHPERLADLDPQATLDEINRRFLAVPATGTFWFDPGSAAGAGR